jgi:hypothetical protein
VLLFSALLLGTGLALVWGFFPLITSRELGASPVAGGVCANCNWRTLPGQFWPFCRLASHDSRRISRTWGGRDSAAGSGETSDSGGPFFVGPLDNDQEVADRPQYENLPLVFWDLDQDQGERLFGPGGNHPGHLDCCCDGRGVFTVLRARVRLVCYLVRL